MNVTLTAKLKPVSVVYKFQFGVTDVRLVLVVRAFLFIVAHSHTQLNAYMQQSSLPPKCIPEASNNEHSYLPRGGLSTDGCQLFWGSEKVPPCWHCSEGSGGPFLYCDLCWAQGEDKGDLEWAGPWVESADQPWLWGMWHMYKNTCWFTQCFLRFVSFNPLTTDDAIWCCLTLAACYQLTQSVLKIGFVLAKKGGIGGGGWVSARSTVHMSAALAGYRRALVSTGWTISHLVSTNRLRNHSSPHVGAPLLDL